MIVRKPVDIEVRIENSHALRLQEEIELEIDGREAAQAILGDGPLLPTQSDLKYLLNRVGAFIKGVGDEEIARMTPEVRAMVADFLRSQAARFEK